jgi:glucose-1-phosphate cytidylyltransferase
MKVAILAGGKGTRLAEETEVRPKPMVEIGGEPILWHIMKIYAHYGFKDFVVALGYKGDHIKRWFVDYCDLSSNLTVNLADGSVDAHRQEKLDWTIDLIDTGYDTGTAGRIAALRSFLGNETFMLTWGDGVSNVDIKALLAFHQSHGKLCTLTAARPPARYGHLEFEGDQIVEFSEKPQTGEGWINGAFFVCEPGVFDYIPDDPEMMFERVPLEGLAEAGQLMAYKHDDFWQCMDTLRDKHVLETMWENGQAPWKVWS